LHKSLSTSGRGYELICSHYFSQLDPAKQLIKISRSSYCEARDKLSWEAFAYLQDMANLEHSQAFNAPLWKGHRVQAVDGSCIQLPHSKEILATFPVRTAGGWGQPHYPVASLVIAVNVYTGQVLESAIGNKHSSEPLQIRDLIKGFRKGDITLLDRGFQGKDIWREFDESEQHYVCRVKAGAKEPFFNKNLKDQVVELECAQGARIKVRVIRGPKLGSGHYLFLATNLMNAKKYSRTDVLELFKRRQAVEEVFLHLKQTLNVKNIRSKKVNGVLQEIYAALAMLTIVAGLRYLYNLQTKNKKVSFKAIACRLESAIGVLLSSMTQEQLKKVFQNIQSFTHTTQPNRKYPRWSKQPVNKWIVEKSKKARQARQRK